MSNALQLNVHSFALAGAILLAQWMNPWNSISAESVVRELDDIAILVATRILAKQRAALDSTCPLVPTRPSSELMGQVRGLGLDACAVLDEMNAVLYGQLGFRPSSQEEYYDDLNSYIHMVLRGGGRVCLHDKLDRHA